MESEPIVFTYYYHFLLHTAYNAHNQTGWVKTSCIKNSRIISLLGFIVCRYRDFAYVARDRTTRKHMCHVFRCDIPARTIANTLRDICKKIMIERSLQQNLAKPIDISEYKPKQNKGTVVLTQTLRKCSVTMIELCYHNIDFSLKVD